MSKKFIKRDYAKFLELYYKNNAAYYTTCEEMGIRRSTIDTWRKENPEFEKDIQEVNRLIAEKVEKTMVDSALDPKGAPVLKIFYLKNNWRDKYGERVEHNVTPSALWFENKKIIEGEIVEPKQLKEENETIHKK
jgi:hypothetical protein